MWADTILIVVISICTALLGEGNHSLEFIFVITALNISTNFLTFLKV